MFIRSSTSKQISNEIKSYLWDCKKADPGQDYECHRVKPTEKDDKNNCIMYINKRKKFCRLIMVKMSYLPIYVNTQRESPNLIESIMFSTRKRRRSSTIPLFNLLVALLAISLTLSGAMVTSIPRMSRNKSNYIFVKRKMGKIK